LYHLVGLEENSNLNSTVVLCDFILKFESNLSNLTMCK